MSAGNPEPLVAAGALPASEDLAPLFVHPDERLVDVVRALAIAGFGVYSVPSSGEHQPYLCIAQRWRIEAERKRRARDALPPEQRAAEEATDKAVQRSLASGFE